MEECKNNLDNFLVETIFKDSDIEEIWTSENPIDFTYKLIESHFRRTTGRIDPDTNLLMAQAEFHVNNLIYSKENFKEYPIAFHTNILNLLSILLNLNDKIYYQDPAQNVDEEFIKRTNSLAEPDFALICKSKLNEIRNGLQVLQMIPSRMDKEMTQYLNKNDVKNLLEYIRTFYFPYIRLFYYFTNKQRITEDNKIDLIICKPLPVPPLSFGDLQKEEKAVTSDQLEAEEVNVKKEVM